MNAIIVCRSSKAAALRFSSPNLTLLERLDADLRLERACRSLFRCVPLTQTGSRRGQGSASVVGFFWGTLSSSLLRHSAILDSTSKLHSSSILGSAVKTVDSVQRS